MNKQIRQGDLFMIEAGQIDLSQFKAAKKVNKITLLDGEATGHTHQLDGTVATFYPTTDLMEQLFKKSVTVIDDKFQLLGALANAAPNTVTHQEHGSIDLEKGTHWVLRQREYTPQAIRRVMD